MKEAILISTLGGAGLVAMVVALIPAQPDLRSALSRLNPTRPAVITAPGGETDSNRTLEARLGWFVDRYLTRWVPLRVPEADLRILGLSRQQFYGRKATAALVGFLLPYPAVIMSAVAGVTLPIAIPVAVGLGLALALSFIPDADVRSRTDSARGEFAMALAAYLDLVALERASGQGAVSALESAATAGDSWVFRRLREELARARFAGVTPWDALQQLAKELRLPELANLADIMRQAGESGASIYKHLRARAQSIRAAQLAADLAESKARTERMTMPQAATTFVGLSVLAAPAVMTFIT